MPAAGWRWVLMATLAGGALFYGWAYRKGGLLGAVLRPRSASTSIHFTAFTYPMLGMMPAAALSLEGA